MKCLLFMWVFLLFLLYLWVERKDNSLKGPGKEKKQILVYKMKTNTTKQTNKQYIYREREIERQACFWKLFYLHLKLSVLKLDANRSLIQKIHWADCSFLVYTPGFPSHGNQGVGRRCTATSLPTVCRLEEAQLALQPINGKMSSFEMYPVPIHLFFSPAREGSPQGCCNRTAL